MSFIKNNYIKFLPFVIALTGFAIFPIPGLVIDMFITMHFILSILLTLSSFVFLVMPPRSIFPYCLMAGSFFRITLGLAITRGILFTADSGYLVFKTGDFILGGNALIGSAVFLFLISSIFCVVYRCIKNTTASAGNAILNLDVGNNESDKELLSWENTKEAMSIFKREAIFHASLVSINLLVGYVMATTLYGMSHASALQTFTILTIGAGLLIQIPILFIAVAVNLTISCKKDIDTNKSIPLILFAFTIIVLKFSISILLIGFIPVLPPAPFMILSSAGPFFAIFCAQLQRGAAPQANRK